MHQLLRGAGLALLLLASAGSASAMDPSATEETNCLMACDANQANCHAPGPASVRQNHSRVETASPRGARQTPKMSAAYEAALAHSKEARR
ncbi:MAG: hypothetical protein ACREEK_01970 [Bradyrhizobium sp.]